MQIQNNNSTNFQRIGLNTSQMNRSQKCLAENFYRAIEGSGKYKNIENDLIDIIIMPGKKDNNLIIKFIDKVSGKFIRNPENNVAAQHTYHGSGDIYKFSNKIIDDNFEKPEFKLDDILKRKTDLAKINPDLNEQLINEYNELVSEGLGKEYAEMAMFNVFNDSPDYDF